MVDLTCLNQQNLHYPGGLFAINNLKQQEPLGGGKVGESSHLPPQPRLDSPVVRPSAHTRPRGGQLAREGSMREVSLITLSGGFKSQRLAYLQVPQRPSTAKGQSPKLIAGVSGSLSTEAGRANAGPNSSESHNNFLKQ